LIGLGVGFALIEYAHPVFMVATLALVLLALRHGLTLRRARGGGDLGGLTRGEHRERHLKLGKAAVVCAVVGFAGGVGTTVLVQGKAPVTTFHGLVGSLTLLAFGALSLLGRRLEAGEATDGKESESEAGAADATNASGAQSE